MKTVLTKLFQEFFKSEQISGSLLIFCTAISILIANSQFGNGYIEFWQTKIGVTISGIALTHSIEHWVNDGLMTVFFLLIGLEIERELYIGELSNIKNATLPVLAALGGMITPAFFHLLLNWGTATQAGMGIPMATDIAFALGVLALLGNKVPVTVKIFLAALAIIDDLGAIIVIAVFYSSDFSAAYFALAAGIFAVLICLNRLNVRWLPAYILPGCVLWYCMLKSGIHPTLTGVLLAFAIPFADGGERSPSYRLQHFLHIPVAFIIMPIFALANTGIALSGNWVEGLLTLNCSGIFAGLFAGKPLGIFLFSLLAVKMGLSQLPDDVSWRHIIGAGFLGGIGFTMSIFITLLAFNNPGVVSSSKISILFSSLAAGTVGFFILRKQASHRIPA